MKKFVNILAASCFLMFFFSCGPEEEALGDIEFENYSRVAFDGYVKLRCKTESYENVPDFYYTLDGSEPTEESEKAVDGKVPVTLATDEWSFHIRVLAVLNTIDSNYNHMTYRKTADRVINVQYKKSDVNYGDYPLVKGKGYKGFENFPSTPYADIRQTSRDFINISDEPVDVKVYYSAEGQTEVTFRYYDTENFSINDNGSYSYTRKYNDDYMVRNNSVITIPPKSGIFVKTKIVEYVQSLYSKRAYEYTIDVLE